MTTTRSRAGLRSESVTVGFAFAEREYSVVELSRRLVNVGFLTQLLSDDQHTPSPSPNIDVERIRKESPLEIWLQVVLYGSSGAILANRLIAVVGSLSSLRAQIAKDRFDAVKHKLAAGALQKAAGVDASPDVIRRSVEALVEIEVLTVVLPDAETTVVDGEAIGAPATETLASMTDQQLNRWLREQVAKSLEAPN